LLARLHRGLIALGLALLAVPTRAEPQRIISLAPSVTEILFALGVGDRVVGISSYCDYPSETARIDRVGTFLSPNVELIVTKKPDVVIAVPSPGNQRAVESLRALGLSVLIVDPESVASIGAAIQTVAGAVGVTAAGRALRRQIDTRVAAVTERLQAVTPRTVLMVVDRRPLIAVGAETYQDELIRLARGVNLGAKAGNRWPHVGLEFVVAQAPEVIIDTTMGNDEHVTPMDFWQTFATIPAVREKRIYGYRAFVLLRPGPRVPEALETVARFIHPERFAQ
jgi:iron complex transport system substrate-binding protein